MNFINNILQHPIYILLFGSGGLLAVIISIIALVLRRDKHKDKNEELPQKSTSHLTDDYYTKKYYNTESNYPIPNYRKTEKDNEQEAIDFVSDLSMNSPVKDKISVSKVERKDFNKFL